jgi:MoaA/NifB/PqqE/SkfB family radical SAM enzyme
MRNIRSIFPDGLDGKLNQELNAVYAEYQELKPVGDHVPKLDFAAFHIESKCHLKCIHCFATDTYWGDADYKTTVNVAHTLNKIASLFRRVQFTGGEIFLRRDPVLKKNDLPVLVREAGRRGLESIIQTTGTYFDEAVFASMRAHGATWVSLSLDGPTPEINSKIRGKYWAYDDVIAAIPMIKGLDYRIKVGTCITSLNCDVEDIVQLGRTLAALGVDNWKLMQFYAFDAGRASKQNRWLSIPIPEFESIVAEVRAIIGHEITITSHSNVHHFKSPCVHVYPDGKVAIQRDYEEIVLGHLAEPLTALVERFKEHDVYEPVSANGGKTYPDSPQWTEKIG